MSTSRCTPRTKNLRRLRRGSVHIAILTLLLVAELLRPFGGTTVMAHGHSGEGLHFHIAPSPGVVDRLAAWRDTDSCWGCQSPEQFTPFCDHSSQASCSHESDAAPTGFLVSIPDFDDALIRGIQPHIPLPFVSLAFSLPLPLAPPTHDGMQDASPGGSTPASIGDQPLHACARIVRTSHALLI